MLGRCFNLCFATFSAYAIINYYPTQALEVGLSMWFVGLVFSFYSLGGLLMSYYYPSIMIRFSGKRKLLKVISNGILMISCLIFAFLPKIKDKPLFMLISIITRFQQGIFSFLLVNMAFGEITVYSNNEEKKYIKYISYVETSTYVGIFGGPFYAGAMSQLMGYDLMLFSESLIILFSLIVDLNEERKYDFQKNYSSISRVKEKRKSYLNLLKNWKFGGIFVLGVLNASACYVVTSGFAINVVKLINCSIDKASMIFSILSTVSCVVSILYGLIKWKVGKEFHIQIGSIFLLLGLIFIGPAPFIQQSIYVVILGLFMLGIGGVFGSISLIAIFKDNILLSNEDFSKDEVNNIAASLYGFIWSIGTIYGYIASGIILDFIDYKYAMFIFGIILLSFLLIYFFFIGGSSFFIKQFVKKKNINTEQLRDE